MNYAQLGYAFVVVIVVETVAIAAIVESFVFAYAYGIVFGLVESVHYLVVSFWGLMMTELCKAFVYLLWIDIVYSLMSVLLPACC